MFDLGNGIWVALEFIVSVIIQTDLDTETVEEWRTTVEVSTTNGSYKLYGPDRAAWLGYPAVKGLLSQGYASPQDFCERLLAAISKAKR